MRYIGNLMGSMVRCLRPSVLSTHGYHQMVNTKITRIPFVAAEVGEAAYSQQKEDPEPTVAQMPQQNSSLH